MTRKIVLSLLGIAFMVGAYFLSKWIIDNKEKPKSKPRKEYKIVEIDTVRNSTISIEVQANGNLVAKNRIELYAEVQGVFRPIKTLYRAGQRYERGQVIININDTEFKAQVQSARSNLINQITGMMPDLRLDYPDSFSHWQKYLNQLRPDKTLPALPNPINEQEKYFVTGRNIYAAYYDIKNLEERLVKHRIYAPYDGVLTEALVTEGTLIRAGQKLGEFIDTDVYELEASISAEFVDLLSVGRPVMLQTINERNEYQGEVTRINARVDPSSQTVSVVIEVSHPDLKDGMYLKASLEAQQIENTIEVDRSLLQDGNKIFSVKDGKLDLIEVLPAHFTDELVVLKNVPDDTVIITRTVPGAYDGMLVRTEAEAKELEEGKEDNKAP